MTSRGRAARASYISLFLSGTGWQSESDIHVPYCRAWRMPGRRCVCGSFRQTISLLEAVKQGEELTLETRRGYEARGNAEISNE